MSDPTTPPPPAAGGGPVGTDDHPGGWQGAAAGPGTPGAGAAAGTAPGPAPTRPPLRRPRQGRILGGVGAGLGEHLGIDVAIVRVLLVVFAIVTSGLGVLAYIAAWILIAEQTPAEAAGTASAASAAPVERTSRGAAFWIGISVLVVGVLLLIGSGGAFAVLGRPIISGSVLWPLVLIAFGVALWRSGEQSARPVAAGQTWPTPGAASPAAPSPTAPTQEAAMAVTTDQTTVQTTGQTTERSAAQTADPTQPIAPPGAAPWTPQATPPAGSPPQPPVSYGDGRPDWTPPPVPPRRRSLLTRVTLGLALLVVAVLWSLNLTGAADLGAGRIVAAALLVIGVGLLVGSVLGRGRWLLLPAALLVPIVLFAEVVVPLAPDEWRDAVATGEVGDRREVVRTPDDLQASYQLGAGSFTLDLRDLELGDEALATSIQIGAGEVLVMVPEGLPISADARVGAGDLNLGRDTSLQTGIGLRGSRALTEADTGPGSVHLDISVGLGTVQILQQPKDVIEPDPGDVIEPDADDVIEPDPDDVIEPDPGDVFEDDPDDATTDDGTGGGTEPGPGEDASASAPLLLLR